MKRLIEKIKELIEKIKNLPLKKRIVLLVTVILTAVLCVAVVVVAWFYRQRKAAEMYKVEFPNSLYLNAAQREDRMYFNMNAISQYKIDPVTDSPVHDEQGNLIPVNSQKYVFAVSGSSVKNYKIQLAHTNNNQFTYKIYPATQYDTANDVPSGTSEDDIVLYNMHADSHNENTMQIVNDEYSESGSKYYVKGSAVVPGEYKNDKTDVPKEAESSGPYYEENYGSLTNVQKDDIPSYWQSESIPVTWDSNKKFCHYYIIEVTWEKRAGLTFESKETDMVYITASR